MSTSAPLSKLQTFSGDKLHPGILIIPFAVLTFFSGHRDPTVSLAGNAILGATSFIAFFLASMMLIVEKPIERSTFRAILAFSLLVPIYGFWCFDKNQELRAIGVKVIQILTVISTMYVAFCIGRSGRGESAIKIFAAVCSVLLVARIGLMIIFRNTGGFDSYNTNTVGLWIAAMILIPLFFKGWAPFKILVIAAALVGLFLTNSRTAIGAIFLGLAVYFAWPIMIRNRFVFWLPVFSLFGFAVLVVYFLGGDRNELLEYNLLFREWTGKNLLSGRERLWPELLKAIGESPWIGWGGGVSPTTLRMANVSSHNLFLQVLLQVGVIGLIPIILFTVFIWQSLWKYRLVREIRTAASLFFIVVLCQSFEVTLFQVNLALGLPMWLAVGLALGRAYSIEGESGSQRRGKTTPNLVLIPRHFQYMPEG